jgi:hypothetical protein
MELIYKAENKLAGRCVYCGVDDGEIHLDECAISLKNRMDILEHQSHLSINDVITIRNFVNNFKSLSYEFNKLEAMHTQAAEVYRRIRQDVLERY